MFYSINKSQQYWRAKLNIPAIAAALVVVIALVWLYGYSISQLIMQQGQEVWLVHLKSPYLYRVLSFSFYQAFLSATLSIVFGVMVAHALFYTSFKGKKLLISLFSLTMVLPVLVVIFGVLGVYGKAGWLATCLRTLGIEADFNIYGLSGILVTHIFCNIPWASKLFLDGLHAIPHQQRQLSAQLGLPTSSFFRYVEWPYIRQSLPSIFSLIFMLCFTSFTVVLIMGGGPKYTTLEVAIYQAIQFEFDLPKAAIFALLQFICCAVLFQLSTYFSGATATAAPQGKPYLLPLPRWVAIGHYGIIMAVIIFMSLPLFAVLASSLSAQAWISSLSNSQFWKAFSYSALMAPSAGALAVFLSVLLLLGARNLHWLNYHKWANQLLNMGMIILAIPTLVLAVGLFLIFRHVDIKSHHLFAIVVLCNALMAMPFVLRIITPVFYRNMNYYEKLCASLGIRGWARFRVIEWSNLRPALYSAMALASALSLGDFTAIALFGSQDFTSLPHLLYQQLGHYRSQEAAVTAVILLFFNAFIFIIIERYSYDYTGKNKV